MPENRSSAAANRVTVIGLGRFGTSLAQMLHEIGYEVTAIDRNDRRVQEAAEYVTLAAQGDGTDMELLQQLNVDQSHVAVVAQGENLEASVLTTLLLKKLNIKRVIAKATTKLHGELLRKVGADHVVFPEIDAGIRLAHSLGVPHIDDYISLSPTAGVAKLVVPIGMVGKTLQELMQGMEGKLNILLIKRARKIITVPHFQEVIENRDELVIVGADSDIESFVERATKLDKSAPDS